MAAENENILYTDGHDVIITDSALRVRKHFYRLNGIMRHSLSIVKPNRIPGIFFIGLGLIVLTVGLASGSEQSNELQIFSSTLGLNIILIICGPVFLIAGVILLIALKEKYGVHIVTEQGEKDVLVSESREYISMVVDVLNKAFINMLNNRNDNSMVRSSKGMTVSSR